MTQPPADGAAPLVGEPASDPGSGLAAPLVPAEAVDFATLVPRYEAALIRYVAQLLGRSDQDLEDIVQDTFLRLHKQVHAHGDDSVQNVSTWLFRVAHNLTMDTLRKRKVRKQTQQKLTGEIAMGPSKLHPDRVEPGPSSGTSPPSDPVAAVFGVNLKLHHDEDTLGDMERKEACERAMAELQTLPDHQKQALTLKMVQGLTIRQIAQITDTSIGNVGYRISQGLSELSRRLKKAGVI